MEAGPPAGLNRKDFCFGADRDYDLGEEKSGYVAATLWDLLR